jgi:hypothetical protein
MAAVASRLKTMSLAALRSRRVARPRDTSLASAVEEFSRGLRRTQGAAAGAGAAWDGAVPADLRAGAVLESLSRGVLTVRVPDDAARFVLDRFLRSGGLNALARAGVRRVKLVGAE